jgi:DNA-binding CsgD family transcriptional regulator
MPGDAVDATVSLIVEMAVSAMSLEDYRREALMALEHLVGFDFAIAWRIDGPPMPSYGTVLGFERRHWERFCRDSARYEPELGPLLQRATNTAVRDRDVFGVRERDRMAFYDEIIHPVGSREYITGVMVVGTQPVGVVQIGRGRGATAAFTPEDAAALTRALPALALGEAVRHRPARIPDGIRLTTRERQLIEYARLGHTIGQVALANGTSPNTVRNQFARLYRKLGVSTRAELVGLVLG